MVLRCGADSAEWCMVESPLPVDRDNSSVPPLPDGKAGPARWATALVPVRRVARAGLAYLPRGQSLTEDVWRVRHRTLSYLLRLHVLGIFVYALARGFSPAASASEAAVVAVFALLAATDIRRRKFVSAMNAVGLVTSSAVLVQVSGGLIEMHFHFFVMVGILTLYQDWMPFLLAIGFVVLHHGVLGTLDPRAVYNHPDAVAHPFTWALIHGGFVLAASVASVVAWRLNEDQAFRDALTHLPNRALFQDRLSHALARSGRSADVLAVLFVDLDGFKDVNDSLGHAAGDQLLCAVAERLRSCARPGDTVARLGGDEFAILLEDLTDKSEAIAPARRVLDAVATPITLGGGEETISASIGIAVNRPGDTVDTLLRNADVAMYTVKEGGRAGLALFAEDMHTTVIDRVELEHKLRGAPTEDFLLHYQPVVALDTGRVVGFEALLRWQHPTRGLLPSDDFLDVAIKTGKLVAIGERSLLMACHQARQWQDQFDDATLTVAVNLSALELLHDGLVEVVGNALSRTSLEPATLVLELTEQVLVTDVALAADRLAELKALGVRLAIDGFGTGYSSVDYLVRFPFDQLKIDRAFTDPLVATPTGSILVKGILDLAHALGLQSVASGVEHPDQAQAFTRLGCQLAQGVHIAPPVPATTIDSLSRLGCLVPAWSYEANHPAPIGE